jgi:peptidoglycan/LPS O-acetylase OafA/YrhL
MAAPSIRTNNFDLIRLLAALQVVVHHSIGYLQLYDTSKAIASLFGVLLMFSGVPIFFFVSGFLISKSYESSAAVSDYARNRLLRIYPALIVCTIVSIASVYALGYLPRPSASPGTMLAWIAGQLTFVQFFNPDFMRGYGVGVLNGSLWTITVELQFYLLVPLLYLVCGTRRQLSTVKLSLLTAMFLVANVLYWRADPENHPTFAMKLFGVTFIPWFYMFLLGVFAQRHFIRLHGWLSGRLIVLFVVYVIAGLTARSLGVPVSNDIHPALYLLLAALIFAAAFTAPSVAERTLHRNDISYGVYIYHQPCLNALIQLGFMGRVAGMWITLAVVPILAALSWRFVERPCLALKRSGTGHFSPNSVESPARVAAADASRPNGLRPLHGGAGAFDQKA